MDYKSLYEQQSQELTLIHNELGWTGIPPTNEMLLGKIKELKEANDTFTLGARRTIESNCKLYKENQELKKENEELHQIIHIHSDIIDTNPDDWEDWINECDFVERNGDGELVKIDDEEELCDFCDKPRKHLVKRDAGYDEHTCQECYKEQYPEEEDEEE
tara:strand:+ start:3189 stop:3668 length:480 start_codon:yes stop_codon:yes gene_type:complete